MLHYFNINGKKVTVDFECDHPDLMDNTCPTCNGDCIGCKWCRATMLGSDAWYMLSQLKVAVAREE